MKQQKRLSNPNSISALLPRMHFLETPMKDNTLMDLRDIPKRIQSTLLLNCNWQKRQTRVQVHVPMMDDIRKIHRLMLVANEGLFQHFNWLFYSSGCRFPLKWQKRTLYKVQVSGFETEMAYLQFVWWHHTGNIVKWISVFRCYQINGILCNVLLIHISGTTNINMQAIIYANSLMW